MMSDTVLLEAEVNPLIDATHAASLEIGAIHNHFFYEQPRIFYMHLHGLGSKSLPCTTICWVSSRARFFCTTTVRDRHWNWQRDFGRLLIN